MRKLLILTAVYTGHGHKSISDALTERLTRFEDLEIMTVDGFDLMTKIEKVCYEKTYGPITRLPGKAWGFSYALGMRMKTPVQRAISHMIEKKFLALIRDFKPDCILTVHPIFLGSVLDILEENNLKIPFISHQADLIDIALQWFDPRVTLNLAPSQEAYDCTVRNGIDPAKLMTVGFPVRSRFMGLRTEPKSMDGRPLTITVMSGSEGSGIIHVIARELLHKTDVNLNIVCGRNKRLRERLRHDFGAAYHDRLNAMGFVEKIQDVMVASDVLVMRASPNSVMEAVALNKPIILFGQLAGQELHNPDMLTSHGLAAHCPDPTQLVKAIEALKANDGEGIRKMLECQRAYAPEDAALETARIINDFIKPIQYDV